MSGEAAGRNDWPKPEPSSSQKIAGDPIAPITRLGCRKNRTSSRCQRVKAAGVIRIGAP